MKAFLMKQTVNLSECNHPLFLSDIPEPILLENEILIKVSVCGVCHTELDEIEGRTPPPSLPVVPGHQAVGVVIAAGRSVRRFQIGDRIGAAWIFSTCGVCHYCRSNRENLCPDFKATGRDANGGYAEYMKVGEDFAYLIPQNFSDAQAAPLLCAGAIGYRSLHLTGLKDGQNLGLTGFGASAHLVMKMAKKLYPNSSIYVFARNGDERAFARELGAVWAGSIKEAAPVKLDAIIDTTPVWLPILEALKNLAPGGRLVINAIRKEDADKDLLLELDYSSQLWMEKEIKSVANVARSDVADFLKLASQIFINPIIEEYPFVEANTALLDLKQKRIRGAKVLRIS
ncbi:MAG TPA: zinc-dependent alcohol dehydrogenase family protein [Candidatus Sumerlaeota bacterium]|nr:zinc-dependent alcohol dehydrogenase family protein [Candidatus Sumerlaeota bacterium]HON49901.1 zinc-dependent alcohol dehydrogenase family protein [Candidatus Sumerlaeota bacterium]HOR63851.1 zinc-dependent alcohol dehydrogenase family protein [Candidatus Sumerlaeota bacterium]HPL74397.1 zinc-dependent alcohol dehydrogenase family protein [Candidatus Sumerlaeota bacterium]HRU54464.1 zinc-dependent alcohol dehydrogenase family protein [Candidatus Sumerlaeia bacterium]